VNFRLRLLIGETLLILSEGAIIAWFYRNEIRDRGRNLKAAAKRVLGQSTFFALRETFFNESAVLWFVFPLLDAIYTARRPEEKLPSTSSILGSFAVALFLFIVGLKSGIVAKKKFQEEREIEGR